MLLFAVTRRYCANTVLFKVHHKSYPNEVLTSYGISDDQNNCILTKLERFDYAYIEMNYSTFYTVFEFWLSADEWMQSFWILCIIHKDICNHGTSGGERL